MSPRMSVLLYLACLAINCQGFYKPKTYKKIDTYTPKTVEELKDLLCVKKTGMFQDGSCDSDPKRIVLNEVFDFTDAQGSIEADACQPCPGGQWTLKSSGQCGDAKIEKVEYSKAGLDGLAVGSNKIIVGINGGGLKGKGLLLDRSTDVQIMNLAITDINPHLLQGGRAIELVGAKNVLIDGNYFKEVGGAMVLSAGGSSTGVTVSANHFDGATAHSPHCDGARGFVWWVSGKDERVQFEHNTVHHAAGALVVSAQGGSKTVVQLSENVIYAINHPGVALVEDKASSVLVEGNVFADLAAPVDAGGEGNVYVSQTEAEELACIPFINRKCDVNTIVRSDGGHPNNNVQVLRDVKVIYDADVWFWTRMFRSRKV